MKISLTLRLHLCFPHDVWHHMKTVVMATTTLQKPQVLCFARTAGTDLHRSFAPLGLACFRWRNILETLSHIRLYMFWNIWKCMFSISLWKSDAMAFDSTIFNNKPQHTEVKHISMMFLQMTVVMFSQDSGDMYFGVQVWQLSSLSMFSPT